MTYSSALDLSLSISIAKHLWGRGTYKEADTRELPLPCQFFPKLSTCCAFTCGLPVIDPYVIAIGGPDVDVPLE